MADPIAIPQYMQIPVPPESADPEELLRYLKSQHNQNKNLYLTGLQVTMVTSADISKMTSENQLSQVAKLFYDTDSDKYYRTKKSGSNLVVEEW